jgi:hypothetical protein
LASVFSKVADSFAQLTCKYLIFLLLFSKEWACFLYGVVLVIPSLVQSSRTPASSRGIVSSYLYSLIECYSWYMLVPFSPLCIHLLLYFLDTPLMPDIWASCVVIPHFPHYLNTPIWGVSYICFVFVVQWNIYSSFSSGVWKRNNESGKTIDAGAIVKIGFAQGP